MSEIKYPWEVTVVPVTAPVVTSPEPEAVSSRPKPRGRRPAAVSVALAATTAPDWLFHHLTISGSRQQVQEFAAAARGAGVIPWQLDFAAIEEDVFVRAVAQPAAQRKLTVAGCRILARQFRERVEARQARAAALMGQSRACPFDLQVLLPVPPTLLQLGPTHPTAVAWLQAHWGITDRLRQVVVRDKPTLGRRLPRHHAVIGYGFFTDGETPAVAVHQLADRHPDLRFQLVPRPAG